MTYLVFDYLDSWVEYLKSLSLNAIMNTYWFLFFIEFPRYYLIETVMVLWMKLFRRENTKDKELARFRLYKENPLISVLVPGKNEGKHIFQLVTSMKEQTYQNYELVIVDDGSDDDTPIICKNLQKLGFITIYLRNSIRGGKASAANLGAYYCKGKYIVHLDADSSLDRNAIENILLPFYMDSRVKGVGGCVKVRNNKDTICSAMQALEYLKTIMVGRMVTSKLGIYHVISGAFGAFDREFLQTIGFWDIGPGLDGDITQKIRKAGWKVVFAQDSVCLTSVPVKWSKLFKQRFRWCKSLVRFRMRKHRDILIPDSNFQMLNWISNAENILFDFILNYVWLVYIINLCFTHMNNFLEVLLLGWFIRFVFSIIAFGVIMLVTERPREELFLARYLPLSTLYTGYFLRFARLCAHTAELFFFSSYKDPWNPRKTSIHAQVDGM